MNLALGGRKPSSGESSVCTLLDSSAASIMSSIWLNLECRENESLPDMMQSITIIFVGALQRFEIQNWKFEMKAACRRTTFWPRRGSLRKRISRAFSAPTQSTDRNRKPDIGTQISDKLLNGTWSCLVMGHSNPISVL